MNSFKVKKFLSNDLCTYKHIYEGKNITFLSVLDESFKWIPILLPHLSYLFFNMLGMQCCISIKV